MPYRTYVPYRAGTRERRNIDKKLLPYRDCLSEQISQGRDYGRYVNIHKNGRSNEVHVRRERDTLLQL